MWATQKDKNVYDIKDWINFKNSVEELGCIHTTQGADLNNDGVILGAEIDYNYTGEENGDYDLNQANIIVNPKEYKDRNGLLLKETDLNNEKLASYIKRIYYVVLSRGINGCYVYAVNNSIQRYLKKIVKVNR